ncbi:MULTISPECIES: hypothetical protein [unclassified Streptomyces]|uniref:hypothetical protein n=1 Tax=Streptomyces TaxID=1883 RepID=UPI00081B9C76|nr:hypothetical protein [Streptomyces sp. BvitLS-983]MYX88498.1 hypothetical protein [Streptomyces sp. SID4915]SCE17487.1 hypothetical protein GA0115250_14483 [Streptomyces sp. BvitLS-983]
MKGPMVSGLLWVRVVKREKRTCTSCGRTRVEGDPAVYDLVVAPADPRTPTHEAVRTPEAELHVWCPACYTRATRPLRRGTNRLTPQTETLFDLEP